tara:strand:+ start:4240 stop:5238 length:999 start_codon:yes stop_codon:yes gene_type:complete
MKNIKGIIGKVQAIDQAAAIVDSEFTDLKHSLITEINTVERKAITTDTSIKYSNMKTAFGKLFYGCLVPINGVASKNRRFKDGSWEVPDDYSDRQAIEGPCVWKKIGKMNSYSTRAHWFDQHQVFDGLKQEHIDLIIDGLRNRKDQRKTAKALFTIRNDIKALMDASNAQEEDHRYGTKATKRDITLSKSYNIQLIPLGQGHNDDKVPLDSIPAKIYKASLQGVNISFEIDMDQADKDYLKDNYKFEFSSYGYGQDESGVCVLPLSDTLEKYPQVSFGWNSKCMVLGMYDPYTDTQIDTAIEKTLADRIKAAGILDKAKVDFAGRLLMKGVF